MTLRFRIGVVAAAAVVSLPASLLAAPQGMLNKTVSMSFEVSIPATNSAGRQESTRRAMQKQWYVSSAGRVFSRTARQAGRVAETKDVTPGSSEGAPRIQGNTIVGTVGMISGAMRLVVAFDSTFSSCTASVTPGREGGRAITWKGMNGEIYTATGPVSVSTPSCSVQSGNAFAGQ